MSDYTNSQANRLRMHTERLSKSLMRPLPLSRIAMWSAAFFFLILHGTSRIDTRLKEEAGHTPEVTRVFTRDGVLDRMPTSQDDTFFIAVIGASECYNHHEREWNPQASLAHSLLEAIPADVTPNPIIRDYSFAGRNDAGRYQKVLDTLEEGADLILVTYAIHGLYGEINRIADTTSKRVVKRRSNGNDIDPNANSFLIKLMQPSRFVNTALISSFSSYENKFENSLFRFVRPWDVLVEDDGGTTDNQTGVLVEKRNENVNRNTARLQKLLDEDISLTSVVDILSAPAREAQVPFVFIMMPVDNRILTRANLNTAQSIDALYENYSMNTGTYEPLLWSVLTQDVVPEESFRDAVHLKDFEPLTSELLELLLKEKKVPSTWKSSHEN